MKLYCKLQINTVSWSQQDSISHTYQGSSTLTWSCKNEVTSWIVNRRKPNNFNERQGWKLYIFLFDLPIADEGYYFIFLWSHRFQCIKYPPLQTTRWIWLPALRRQFTATWWEAPSRDTPFTSRMRCPTWKFNLHQCQMCSAFQSEFVGVNKSVICISYYSCWCLQN